MTVGRYPLATSDGQAIPFHVLQPVSLGRIDFSATPTGVVAIGVTDNVATLQASADCIVRFGAAVSVPADETELSDALYVPTGFIVSIQYPADGISVVQVSEAGSLWIQLYQPWELLRSSLAQDRR